MLQLTVLLPFQTIISSLKKSEISGGTKTGVPIDFSPSIFLGIKFPDTGKEAQLGNDLTPEEAGGRNGSEPIIGFISNSDHQGPNNSIPRYTIVSIDPDAPSRVDQSMGPWRHWIREGLTPKDLDKLIELKEEKKKLAGAVSSSDDDSNLSMWIVDENEKGSLMTPWAGPTPGAGSGPHRYVFLLFLQGKESLLPIEKQSTIKSNERIDRRHFDIDTFIVENDLTLVGVNYFMCENPESSS